VGSVCFRLPQEGGEPIFFQAALVISEIMSVVTRRFVKHPSGAAFNFGQLGETRLKKKIGEALIVCERLELSIRTHGVVLCCYLRLCCSLKVHFQQDSRGDSEKEALKSIRRGDGMDLTEVAAVHGRQGEGGHKEEEVYRGMK